MSLVGTPPNAKNRVWEGLPSAEYRTWGPEPTLVLLCGPNPPPNPGRTPNLNDTGISLDGEVVCMYDMYETIRLESQLTRKW
jgi:hypothetical protein